MRHRRTKSTLLYLRRYSQRFRFFKLLVLFFTSGILTVHSCLASPLTFINQQHYATPPAKYPTTPPIFSPPLSAPSEIPTIPSSTLLSRKLSQHSPTDQSKKQVVQHSQAQIQQLSNPLFRKHLLQQQHPQLNSAMQSQPQSYQQKPMTNPQYSFKSTKSTEEDFDITRNIEQLENPDDSISPPKDIIRMIALPPRDLIPGSTKGMPYKVRFLHTHRQRNLMAHKTSQEESDLSGLGGFHNSREGVIAVGQEIVKWMRRRILNFESFTRRAVYDIDLHGGIVGVGEYFSYIEIGGKSIRVQIDTGSSTLAVPMKGCSSCINKVNRYDVEGSIRGNAVSCDSSECASDRCTTNCPVCSERGACCSTERPSECGFSLRYADGSAASGSVVRDEMRWGSHLRVNVTFGGILRNSPNFERPEVDGILGMAFKSLACNPSCFDPPFDALVNSGLVQDVFSICMTNTGGKLMLGGFDNRVAKSRVEYVKLSHSGTERYYRVTLDGKLGIAGQDVEIPDFHTAIVDTGTTLIVTSTRAFATIKEQMQRNFCEVPELCTEDSWFQSGMCVNLGDEELELMPTLTFKVGGYVKITLRPQDYMLSYKRGRRKYRCVGIMGMDGLGGMVVLGNTLMQRYVTVYDRKNGRIGFALAAPKCGD